MKVASLKNIWTCLFVIPAFVVAQRMPELKSFASLPDAEGMAGMFAGKSNGKLFCMGGANFPDKKPWEGGKKIWYDFIFMLDENNTWVKMKERMPSPLAYGVTVEYKEELILIGGNNEKEFRRQVLGLKWNGEYFSSKNYPELPLPLANMAGALVGSVVVIAGGNSSFTGEGLGSCYALDLEHLSEGWIPLSSWPGPARNQPVAGSFANKFYLFSGEVVARNQFGNPQRQMLQDAYKLQLKRNESRLTGEWEILPSLPKSVSASANPVPVNSKGEFIFWGGVDAGVAIHKDPTTHPGNDQTIICYASRKKKWKILGSATNFKAPVTLPSVLWRNYWMYISGEIRPGIRTPAVVGFKNN